MLIKPVKCLDNQRIWNSKIHSYGTRIVKRPPVLPHDTHGDSRLYKLVHSHTVLSAPFTAVKIQHVSSLRSGKLHALKIPCYKIIRVIYIFCYDCSKLIKTKSGGTLTYFDAKVLVDGEVRAKGSMVFTAVPKESVYN